MVSCRRRSRPSESSASSWLTMLTYSITRRSFRRSPFRSCLQRKRNSSPSSLRKTSFFGFSFDWNTSTVVDSRQMNIYVAKREKTHVRAKGERVDATVQVALQRENHRPPLQDAVDGLSSFPFIPTHVDVVGIHSIAARERDQAATDAQRVRQRRSLRRRENLRGAQHLRDTTHQLSRPA